MASADVSIVFYNVLLHLQSSKCSLFRSTAFVKSLAHTAAVMIIKHNDTAAMSSVERAVEASTSPWLDVDRITIAGILKTSNHAIEVR